MSLCVNDGNTSCNEDWVIKCGMNLLFVRSFLAHLWRAYAIPVALSGVRRVCSSSVVRRVSSVSTLTTRNY